MAPPAAHSWMVNKKQCFVCVVEALMRLVARCHMLGRIQVESQVWAWLQALMQA